MPANARSLRLTEQYRTRLRQTRERVDRLTEARWRVLMPQDLDGEEWVAFTTLAVTRAQVETLRATAGYLTAFLSSELGHRVPLIGIDTRRYAGKSRDGRPLPEALQSPIVAVKAELKAGRELPEALQLGLTRALRAVGMDTDQAARQALLEAIDADERFTGWQRAVRGTCGACAGAATGTDGGLHFPVHANCQCVSEPQVSGARDRFPRLTGAAIFAAKSEREQDEMLGSEAAQLVREGLPLSRLVQRQPMATEPDWITQKPLDQLT